jgi:hypothetical protein
MILANQGSIAALLFLLARAGNAAQPQAAQENPFHDCRGTSCVELALNGTTPHALLSVASSVSVEPSSESMQSLSYFIGEWTCDGVFPASGKTITSTMRFDRDLQGNALLKHHDDITPDLYHAIEVWGYDASAKRFNATVLDNFGGARRFSSQGWKDNELTWSSATDITPAQRFVYTRLDEKRYRIDWSVANGGNGFVLGDTLTCKRR